MINLQNLSLKKIALICGFVVVIIVLGWLIYTVFFKPMAPTETPGVTPTTTPSGIGVLPGTEPGAERPTIEPISPGELPSAIARGGVTQTTVAVNSWVGNVTTAPGNKLAYYDVIKEKFFSLDAEGNIVSLSEQKFPDVKNVAWSSTSNKAIIEFPDGANIFYDFTTDKQITLPKHWTDFQFAPEGSQILFKSLGLEPENNFLLTADQTGSGAKILAFLGENENIVKPNWSPNKQVVASYAEPLDGGRSTVNFIGLNDENFKQLIINGFNYDSIWNPNGTQLLYQVSSGDTRDNPSLWIVNAEGQAIGTGRRPLNVQTTVDKCVFADTITLYCAVPRFLPDGSGIFPSLAKGIPDDIYKINVVTASSDKIAELEIPMPISSLTLSLDGRYIYLVDELTNSLRKIKLR